ncbi:HD domain-containing protein [Neobacillus notoginsengisoli]|uniref:HD domain-containing protein n=1 Tax=Neobacillus notoginsengisoli TaxID=1578198 RepID=A0A417YXN7_9BACI|nr:HD domain-containing protein [Neobacillus notoginsengisoli]RHW42344.1 HD domain-containing protein [Neobacillus notoginsengisoli]
MINKIERFVKEQMGEDVTGHDWHHVERVRNNALLIAAKENAGDKYIIEMAALLHDIPDEKLNASAEAGREKLDSFLASLGLEGAVKQQINEIVYSISFKGGQGTELPSFEAKVVQDADRLDAIGAIGIARAFAFGGKKGQPIYAPELTVREHMTLEEYRSGKSSSINHFYEKLLKLKDLMNTETARRMAEERQSFMEAFLKQFYREWECDK